MEKQEAIVQQNNKFREGVKLFLFFFRIGFFTFGGGWSLLAMMEDEFVKKKKTITEDQLLDLIATGKSIPGIMITNISVMFGYSVAGIFGSICATLGMVIPPIIILSVVVLFYDKLKNTPAVYALLKGVRCAVVPIMLSAVMSLGKGVFAKKSGVVICIIAFLVCFFTNISNILIVLVGVVLGLLFSGRHSDDIA